MSANFNLISAELPEADHTTIIDNVKAIEALLPFALTLPADEKEALQGVGVIRIDFTEKTYEYTVKNPGLVPSFMDVAEFEKDLKLFKQLQVIMNHLVPLTDKLKDTYALVGEEAYQAARTFYHHVRNAAQSNIPGASAVAKELGKHFKRSPYRKSDSPTVEPGTPTV
jgi:hypothetical protein